MWKCISLVVSVNARLMTTRQHTVGSSVAVEQSGACGLHQYLRGFVNTGRDP